jgi:hypothetical protein
MCVCNPKKSSIHFKKKSAAWYKGSHSTYKNAEMEGSRAKKLKDYKNASKWFSTAARLRKRHTEMYFDGKFDKGHKTYYNNMLRAAEKCRITAINIKKQNQKKK